MEEGDASIPLEVRDRCDGMTEKFLLSYRTPMDVFK